VTNLNYIGFHDFYDYLTHSYLCLEASDSHCDVATANEIA
jgi:hypothetical protein